MSAQQAIRLIPSLPDHRDDQRAEPSPVRLTPTASYAIIERAGHLRWWVYADASRHISSHISREDAVRFLGVLGVTL